MHILFQTELSLSRREPKVQGYTTLIYKRMAKDLEPWGFVVAVSAFMIQLLTFGVSLSFGLYVIELQKEFHSGLSLISAIGAINLGVQLGAGPLASFLMQKTSYRKVCLLGAVLSSIGLSALPFTPNIPYMIAFYGIITGFGYCFLYVPSHTLSGLWFPRHMGLSTGLVTSGSALGGILFPMMIKVIIETYGWRGSMYIVAAFNLQTIPLSALLRKAPIQRQWERNKNDLSNRKATEEIFGGKCYDEYVGDPVFTIMDSVDREKKHEKHHKVQSSFFRLSRNVCYHLYIINGTVWSAFFAAIVLILPDYFVTVGLNRSDTAWLMSLQHIFSFLGCIVSGFVSSHPKINKVALLVFSNFVSGIVTFAYTYHVLQTFSGFVALSVFGGLSSGLYLGLLVVILADVVGNELIGDGMGLLMFASGIGTVAGPPLGGNLVDETGSFESAFYYNGTAVLLAGIVLAPVTLRGLIRRGKSRKYSVSSFTK